MSQLTRKQKHVQLLFPAGMRATLNAKKNTQAIEYCQQKTEYLRTLSWNDTELNAGTHGPESLSMDNTNDVFNLNYAIIDDYMVADMKKVIVTVSWKYRGYGTDNLKTSTRTIITYLCQ